MYTFDRTARTGVMYSYITDSAVISTLFDILWTLLGISASICFLVVGKWIVDRQFVLTEKVLNRIADVSFGIYLIHPFFLMFFIELQPANTPLVFHSWQIITAVAVTALSWIATVIISKNKFGWLLIGK
jgi:probable poly-beta-1,6-N-acetyl-D-glucosamine export protein